jgi:hypothetical protein
MSRENAPKRALKGLVSALVTVQRSYAEKQP